MIYALPAREFSLIDEQLKPFGIAFEYSSGTELTPETESCEPRTYVFHQGAVSVERQNNGMMLGLLTAPGIFGLALGVMPTAAPFKIVVEMTCKGYYLPASTTLMLLERHQLWREAFYWMTWQNRLLDARDVQLVGTTSYNQIRSTLLSMAQWDAALRARIGVMSYIQRRTHISRSVIAEVLSALRQGDYIRMQKGKLVSINRLPSEY